MTDWKQQYANEAEKALAHPLVVEVIEEFLGNIGRSDALTRYGINKIGTYVAQVARAQALGIDPDVLRMSEAEVAEHMERRAQAALDAGVPVYVIAAEERG